MTRGDLGKGDYLIQVIFTVIKGNDFRTLVSDCKRVRTEPHHINFF